MSFFRIHEPFLFGKYSQLNPENNEKTLCFLHEIEGDILFSVMNEGYALVFYIKDSYRFSLMDTNMMNTTFVFRYYSLIDTDSCINSENESHKIVTTFEMNDDEIYFKPIIIKTRFYDEIIINNSSMISFLDVDDNIIVYSKLYDNMIFHSMMKKLDKWNEDFVSRFYGDMHRRNTQQTIGLKILHKNYRNQAQVLAVYVRYNKNYLQ